MTTVYSISSTGCPPTNALTVTVTVKNKPTITKKINKNLETILTADNGTNNNYVWTPDNSNLSAYTGITVVATPTSTTKYTVTSNECTDTITVKDATTMLKEKVADLESRKKEKKTRKNIEAKLEQARIEINTKITNLILEDVKNINPTDTAATLKTVKEINKLQAKINTIPSPMSSYSAIDDSTQITFFNGANFDFTSNANTGYVGIINIFAPDFYRKKFNPDAFVSRFGVNAGAMKINFVKAGDSINTSYSVKQNVLLHPLDSITPGSKYLRQYNTITTVSKNTTFSFFVQPLLRLSANGNHYISVFFHAHFEFFINKWTTTTSSVLIQQDTAIATTQNASSISNTAGNNKYTSTSSSFSTLSTAVTTSSYWGAGFTFVVKPIDKLTFFFQPTLGYVTNYGQPEAIDNSTLQTKFNNKSIPFFLTRAYFKFKFTSSLEGVIGLDLRSNANSILQQPLYACYFGANIGINV